MTEPQTYYQRFQITQYGNILEETENLNEFEDDRAIPTGEALEYEILRERKHGRLIHFKNLSIMYPESEKLQETANVHSTLHQFNEWLNERGYYIEHDEIKSAINYDNLINEFMGVSASKLEKERRQMLESARQHNHPVS